MRADWISPWWQAALLPDKWDVCGVTVPPLSVWHTFALENIGNAYLCGGKPGPDDAESLLIFASRDMAAGKRLFVAPFARARVMRKLFRRLRKMEWEDVDAACSEYVTECTRTASRWRSGSEKPGGVPYQWRLVQALRTGQARTLDEAWNTAYATARCLFDAGAESRGDDSIMTTEAQEMEDNWPAYDEITGTKLVGIN